MNKPALAGRKYSGIHRQALLRSKERAACGAFLSYDVGHHDRQSLREAYSRWNKNHLSPYPHSMCCYALKIDDRQEVLRAEN
jgi:hypothetical protein